MICVALLATTLLVAAPEPRAAQWNRLGQAAWARNDLPAAYVAFTQALVQAYSAQLVWNRGRVLEELGARDMALAHFDWLGVDASGLEPALLEKLPAVRARVATRPALATLPPPVPSLRCDDPVMVAVAPGPFWRPTRVGVRLEARVVYLSAYCIDRSRVTVSAYAGCVAAERCRAASPGVVSSDPRAAVSGVSWLDAQTYCAWRGGFLPTEAQLWRLLIGVRDTWPPLDGADGSGPRLGGVGVFDAEWVADRFGFGDEAVSRDPTGAPAGAQRVSIGLLAAGAEPWLASSWRRGHDADNRLIANVSFRCMGRPRVKEE